MNTDNSADLESVFEAARKHYECKPENASLIEELAAFESFIKERESFDYDALRQCEGFAIIRKSYLSMKSHSSSAIDVLDTMKRILFPPQKRATPSLSVRKLFNKYSRFTS